MKPIAIKPVKIIVIPKPLNGPGMFEYCNFILMADMETIANAHPTPDPKPKTTDSGEECRP